MSQSASHVPVVVDAVRTPIGRFRGALKDVRPDDLAASALRALVERTRVPVELIDDVILGCANQAGEDNRNVARMALLLAGLPQSISGVTVNRLCGSGLEAVLQAARAIRAGEGEVFLAGGVESMTRAPFAMPKSSQPFPNGNVTVYDTSLGWRFPNPRLEAMFPLEAMGETAENLVEKYGIARAAQDAFALASHEKAASAQAAGRFQDELAPVEIAQGKGKPPIVVDRDEGPPLPIEHVRRQGRAGVRPQRGPCALRHRLQGFRRIAHCRGVPESKRPQSPMDMTRSRGIDVVCVLRVCGKSDAWTAADESGDCAATCGRISRRATSSCTRGIHPLH